MTFSALRKAELTFASSKEDSLIRLEVYSTLKLKMLSQLLKIDSESLKRKISFQIFNKEKSIKICRSVISIASPNFRFHDAQCDRSFYGKINLR